MNMFFHELKASLKSLLIWSGIIILFVLASFSKFSAFYDNADMLAKLNIVLQPFLSAFKVNTAHLTMLVGFYREMGLLYAVTLAIAAVLWGCTTFTKEAHDRTIEFLASKPVSRNSLVTAKVAAAALDCVVLSLVAWGITLVAAQRYSPNVNFYQFVAVSELTFLIIQMIFLAVGIFLGCAIKKSRLADGLSIAILLSTFFIGAISGLGGGVPFLKLFSPFKFFDSLLMINEFRLDVNYVLLSAAIVALCMVGAYLTYKKRDLYI
jgi:ABC-2 type transport system permease protein